MDPDAAAPPECLGAGRSVLLTADDFGLCPEVNEAICLLYDRGVVRRTSLIANTEHFDLSLRQLQERPGLEVGIHLNLTDGRPVLPPEEAPTLVNGRRAFYGGRHYRVLAGIVSGRFSRAQIHAEWRAQIARAVAAGIHVTHLNSHGHLHLLPAVQAIVLDLVEEFQIRFLRLLLSVDSARHAPFRPCSRRLLAEMGRRDLRADYPRRVLGLGREGSLTEALLVRQLRDGAAGLTELIVHPAARQNDYHRRWGYAGERELRALLAADVMQLVRGPVESRPPERARAGS